MAFSTVQFDRIINVRIEQHTYDSNDRITDTLVPGSVPIEIRCPDTGPKPDILLKVSSVGPNNEVNAISDVSVTIRNYELPLAYTLKYNFMKVEVMYQGGGKQTITGHLMRMYSSSPNPNGETTFVLRPGPDGHQLSRAFNKMQMFLQDSVSFMDILTALAQAGYIVESDLDKQWESAKLDCGEFTSYTFSNAYNLIEGVHALLAGYSRAMGWDEPLVFSQGSRVLFCEKYKSKRKAITVGDSVNVVDLKHISQADMSEGTLEVIAPWAPSVGPGVLIRINKTYIAGARTADTGQVALLAASNPKNMILARVMRFNLEFDTNGDTNRMKLACVLQDEKDADIAKKDAIVQDIINFNAGNLIINVLPLTARDANEKMWSSFFDKQDDPGGKDVKAGKKSMYELAREAWGGETFEVKPADGNVKHLGGVDSSMLWPLIALATYKKFKSYEDREEAQEKGYIMSISSDFSCVPIGGRVVVPSTYKDGKWSTFFADLAEQYGALGSYDRARQYDWQRASMLLELI